MASDYTFSRHSPVTIFWVRGHLGIEGNGNTDAFANLNRKLYRYLQHQQKRSCGDQLIHRRLSCFKTKIESIDEGQDPESSLKQADSQTAKVDGVDSAER